MSLIETKIIAGAKGEVSHVMLNRGQKKNALTPEMIEELIEAIREASRRAARSAGALLLTAAPDGTGFCSGFDLRQCREDGDALPRLLDGLSRAIVAMRLAPGPVVIAASGTGGAIAGGCALLGGADYVIADQRLKLGYPVALLGISPAVSAAFLTQSMTMGHARERLLDPALIGAERAAELGLVHEVVKVEERADAASVAAEVNQRGLEAAMRLAEKPANAMKATKAWMNELDASQDEALRQKCLEASLRLVGNADQIERLGKLWGR